MLEDINLFSENNDKICPHLRETINQSYCPRSWLPRFLQKPLEALKNIFVKHRVIIQLDGEYYTTALSASAPEQILGCKLKHNLDHINGFSTKINMNTLKKIVAQKEVAKVYKDRKVRALLDIASPTVNAPQVWNTNKEGNGVGIAVIDTGINPHPDLTYPSNRIKAFKDYVRKRSKPYDDNGHGTHCAGDAAGNGYKSSGVYKGPAPRANLIGVKVLNKYGWGYESTVIAGIQWCITNKTKYGINIISMSLGATADVPSSQDPLCLAVKKAWQAGIVVCVAAGNSGPSSGTIDSPGIEEKVITVGALNDSNTISISDDYIASFSSRGPTIDGLTKPDVISPGVKIISLRVQGSYLDKYYPYARMGKWYSSFSGTSMATPVCAGVAALLLETSPGLTPDQVKALLQETAQTIDPDPYAQGCGLIDAKAAVGNA